MTSTNNNAAPFKFIPGSLAKLVHHWRDEGTGGDANWSIFLSGYTEAGWAHVGDLACANNKGDWTPTNEPILMVPTDNPLVAKPATWYRNIYSQPIGTWNRLNVWIPVSDDPNYIGVACVFRSGWGGSPTPSPGAYYCINKVFLADRTGHDQIIPHDRYYNEFPLYRTIATTRHVSMYNVGYQLLTYSDLQSCCSVGNCPAGGQDRCANYMSTVCTVDDLLENSITSNAAQCKSWCAKDTAKRPDGLTACDSIKTNHCKANPSDALCNCILAKTRPQFDKDSLAHPKIALAACRTSLCRGATNVLLTTSEVSQLATCPGPLPSLAPTPSLPPSLPPGSPTPNLPPGSHTSPNLPPVGVTSTSPIQSDTASSAKPDTSNTTLYLIMLLIIIAVLFFAFSSDDNSDSTVDNTVE